MKKYTTFLVVLLYCVTWLTACKKENGSLSKEDIGKLFNNTVWTGEIKYKTGGLAGIAQPYSIAFNGNGSFEWIESEGDYWGNYMLDIDAKTITLQFSGASNAKLTATITDDNKFGLITPAASYPWEILNGRLNDASGQLENTSWNGSYFHIAVTISRQFKFITGQQVSAFSGSTFAGNYPYIRKNGTLRFTWTSGIFNNFLVLLPGNKIACVERVNGSSGMTVFHVYELSKQ